jgi:hypothetical protein
MWAIVESKNYSCYDLSEDEKKDLAKRETVLLHDLRDGGWAIYASKFLEKKSDELFIRLKGGDIVLEDISSTYAKALHNLIILAPKELKTLEWLQYLTTKYSEYISHGSFQETVQKIFSEDLLKPPFNLNIEIPFSLRPSPSGAHNSCDRHPKHFESLVNVLNRFPHVYKICPGYSGILNMNIDHCTHNLPADGAKPNLNDFNDLHVNFTHEEFPVIHKNSRYFGCFLSFCCLTRKNGHGNFLLLDKQLQKLFWIEPHGSNNSKDKISHLKCHPFIVEITVQMFLRRFRQNNDTEDAITIIPRVENGRVLHLNNDTLKVWQAFVSEHVVFLGHVNSDQHPGLGFQRYIENDTGFCVPFSIVTYFLILSNCNSLHSVLDYQLLLTKTLVVLLLFNKLDDWIINVEHGLSSLVDSDIDFEMGESVDDSRSGLESEAPYTHDDLDSEDDEEAEESDRKRQRRFQAEKSKRFSYRFY